MSKKPVQEPGSIVATPRRQWAQPSKVVEESGLAPAAEALALDIGRMIEAARAQTANAALTTLYWQIGTRIRQGALQQRAQYGAEIVYALGSAA